MGYVMLLKQQQNKKLLLKRGTNQHSIPNTLIQKVSTFRRKLITS
jgi:hypothetical protein